jgi:hypothetical protein
MASSKWWVRRWPSKIVGYKDKLCYGCRQWSQQAVPTQAERPSLGGLGVASPQFDPMVPIYTHYRRIYSILGITQAYQAWLLYGLS